MGDFGKGYIKSSNSDEDVCTLFINTPPYGNRIPTKRPQEDAGNM